MQISAEPTMSLRMRRRERFWNAANAITLGRIAAVPLLLAAPLFDGRLGSLLFGFLFLAIALTDLLDGYVARSWDLVTRIGKLLDPLADKLLVATALVVLLGLGRIPSWATWLVALILAREIAVTSLRAMASAEGVVLGASSLAKWKTGFQIAAITALLVHYPLLGIPAHALGLTLLMLATALGVWSGWDYFAAYLSDAGSGSE